MERLRRARAGEGRCGSGRATLLAGALGALFLAAIVPLAALAESVRPVSASGPGQATSAKLPRFVSLKSDRVNVRAGPGVDYKIAWVFRRAGLPVEVIRELESWRQVRDSEGATGWVLASMLSGRRTALVTPWELKAGQAAPQTPLKADDTASAKVIAQLEAGVLAAVVSCDGRWCRISVDDVRGYVEQKRLWGVYEGEPVR